MTSYSGTFLNSNHAFAALDGYILATPGWSLHATVSSRDKVYTSVGSSGNERIFVRMTAGLEDPNLNGGILRKPALGDGYANSIVLRTYSNFNSSALDGYGETGLVGPLDIFQKANYMYFTDFQNSYKDPGNSLYTFYSYPGYPASTDSDYPGSTVGRSTFDGGHFVYTNFNSSFSRCDLNTLLATTLTSGASRMFGLTYCVNSSDKKAYIYATTETGTSGNQFIRYDISANSWTYMANTPWNNRGNGGVGAWNGRDKLYFFQGLDGASFGYYDIPSGVWTSGPSYGSTYYGNRLLYIIKTAANALAYDRLYLMRGIDTNSFVYLNINPDGTPNGSWTAAASLPFVSGNWGGRLWNFDNENIFYQTTSNYSGSGRDVRRYNIASDTWFATNIFAAPEGPQGGDEHLGHNHYCKIPISDEGPSTQFWFIGSADNFSIVTKDSLSQYDFIYAGLISSYYSRSYATTTGAVSSGVNQSVTVSNGALFTVGQKVFIGDFASTVTSPITQVGLDGVSRKFLPHEQTTVVAKSGNIITLSKLNYGYPSGARVGVDLQPVGVTSFRKNTIHMNNHVNTTLSNATSGLIPQMYRFSCPTKSEITNQSAEDTRTGQYMLWPLTVRGPWSSPAHSGTDYSHSGTEVRGQLNGVYIVDTTGTATAEDYITFLGNNYILFSFTHTGNIYGDSRLFAFGPL